MDTSKLKRFAQHARRLLRDQVKAKMALVLAADSAARRENPDAVKELEAQIRQTSQEQVLDKVAYTWFNRFCALRFMDLNGYNKVRVVSPADESQFQPEILADAKQGHINETRVPDKTRQRVDALLSGQVTSNDPQQEAYRLLVVAECNAFHQAMPYLFERIADYTELLMPDDLLSGNSVLAYTREAMTPDACQDVEVIGWFYQFYISEKKDQVFEGLKKNQKITPENIPAATQLFTPHWIVRYLVENSLGRLWMLNHPNSPLAGQMDYYIAPEQPETDFLRITKPEDIKICDPACGSGHMLTYAFDLLYAIYEEVGTEKTEIAEKILTHNLFGIEIDERAGELAAFALTMKARSRQRRFFSKNIKPNICVIEKILFNPEELNQYTNEVGRELLSQEIRETLLQFTEADNFGSLIIPKTVGIADAVASLKIKNMGGDLFLTDIHQRVLSVLRMVDFLSPRYSVVIANPPYMGKKNMNGALQSFLVKNYSASSSDFYSAFIERSLHLATSTGFTAMVTMDSWMFGDDYTEFRKDLFSKREIRTLGHMGPHAFDEIKGEVVQVAAFIIGAKTEPSSPGIYFDLTALPSPDLKNIALRNKKGRHVVCQDLFFELPRNVCAYFISDHTKKAFSTGIPLKNISEAFTGLQTGDNNRFIKRWSEVSFSSICFHRTLENSDQHRKDKWFPYVKGSEYRKWYGNQEFILDWINNGEIIKSHKSSTIRNQQYYFRSGLAYNNIASKLSVRLVDSGFIFDQKNSMFFAASSDENRFSMSFLHSKIVLPLLRVVAPKDFGPGSMKLLPVIHGYRQFEAPRRIADEAVAIAKEDWDSNESSWGFKSFPILKSDYSHTRLKGSYQTLRDHWRNMVIGMQRLEQNNNRIFIDAYGLQDQLTHEVPLNEITLTCNPHYRYGGDKTEEELEALLLADTMREFISYAVGCMFGRYALDKSGLVLANLGETIEDYRRMVPNSRFEADTDNVIPMLDGEWFADDVTERFRQFLRVTFGDDHYDENLAFIEQALNPKGKRNYTLRDYMLGEFYADHVKRYKKRPIYWLFSSPKGTFNALIYLHRYRPDTASVVLRYLREFRAKLAARQSTLEQVLINPATSQGEKTKAVKEIDSLKKQIIELQDYENDTLYPLATAQVAIDLDDGVKVNYLKLGAALKKITGLDAKEED